MSTSTHHTVYHHSPYRTHLATGQSIPGAALKFHKTQHAYPEAVKANTLPTQFSIPIQCPINTFHTHCWLMEQTHSFRTLTHTHTHTHTHTCSLHKHVSWEELMYYAARASRARRKHFQQVILPQAALVPSSVSYRAFAGRPWVSVRSLP